MGNSNDLIDEALAMVEKGDLPPAFSTAQVEAALKSMKSLSNLPIKYIPSSKQIGQLLRGHPRVRKGGSIYGTNNISYSLVGVAIDD